MNKSCKFALLSVLITASIISIIFVPIYTQRELRLPYNYQPIQIKVLNNRIDSYSCIYEQRGSKNRIITKVPTTCYTSYLNGSYNQPPIQCNAMITGNQYFNDTRLQALFNTKYQIGNHVSGYVWHSEIHNCLLPEAEELDRTAGGLLDTCITFTCIGFFIIWLCCFWTMRYTNCIYSCQKQCCLFYGKFQSCFKIHSNHIRMTDDCNSVNEFSSV